MSKEELLDALAKLPTWVKQGTETVTLGDSVCVVTTDEESAIPGEDFLRLSRQQRADRRKRIIGDLLKDE